MFLFILKIKKREETEVEMKKMTCNLNQLNNENNNLKTDNTNMQNEFSRQQEKLQHQLMQINQLNEKIQVSLFFLNSIYSIHSNNKQIKYLKQKTKKK